MKKRRRKLAFSCISSLQFGRRSRPPLRLMFSLLFLPSVGNFKSAIDTLISFVVFLSRDLKFRLTVQAPFHLVECVVLFQRNALMFFRVEKRGEI
ncbi:MAG: hypothetical protein ACI3YE_07795, partial [Candidatus Avispirillum sp.]